jgi:hypothetical protein
LWCDGVQDTMRGSCWRFVFGGASAIRGIVPFAFTDPNEHRQTDFAVKNDVFCLF